MLKDTSMKVVSDATVFKNSGKRFGGPIMADSNLYQSITDLVEKIDKGNIVLPEFQRDFVWEQGKTYELFDSLIRDIFIGAIIYGKPTFDISIREIDKRPRKGKGSRAKLKVTQITKDEIGRINSGDSFRLVLDGQQRITSIYRALKGIDECWLIVANDDDLSDEISSIEFKDRKLEEIIYEFTGREDINRLSVKLSDVYSIMKGDDTEADQKAKYFDDLSYIAGMDDREMSLEFRKHIKVVKLLSSLFQRELLLPFYLLDMDTQKFALFFERSNSKGIQLNFIDILAAKLFSGFNLREKIEEASSEFEVFGYKFEREVVVRVISYIVSNGKEVDRKYILDSLNSKHFEQYWIEVCGYYKQAMDFLRNNNFVLSYSWMPYENMLIPLIVFLRELKDNEFSQMSEKQYIFIKYWYWASIFSLRYSSGTNEIIIQDCGILAKIAKNKKISDKSYFSKLRSNVEDIDDLLTYTKKGSAIYKGILNLLNFEAQGLVDWKNTKKLSTIDRIEDHHIFPAEYLKSAYKEDDNVLSLIDSVMNKTLMPKITNIKIGKKKPSEYLNDLKNQNKEIFKCLENHFIPLDIVSGLYDDFYTAFLEDRARLVFDLLKKNIFDRTKEIFDEFYQVPAIKISGNIKIFATYRKKRVDAIFDIETQKVLFNGKRYSISQAADVAKNDISGRNDASTNGWQFWKYTDDDNRARSINDFRKRLSDNR